MAIPRPTQMRARPSEEELAALVARHQLGLWRFLRALGADPALADDLLQDTFLVAFERLDSAAAHGAQAAFLRRTARHLFLRQRRDRGRRQELLAETLEQQWHAHGDDDDGERWLAVLRECVDGLEGRSREVVGRFYGQGEARSAVASAMGMKETGVKTLLQRVRAVLRACVERRLSQRGEA